MTTWMVRLRLHHPEARFDCAFLQRQCAGDAAGYRDWHSRQRRSGSTRACDSPAPGSGRRSRAARYSRATPTPADSRRAGTRHAHGSARRAGSPGRTWLNRMSTSVPGIRMWLESMNRMSPSASAENGARPAPCTVCRMTVAPVPSISARGAGSMDVISVASPPSRTARAMKRVEWPEPTSTIRRRAAFPARRRRRAAASRRGNQSWSQRGSGGGPLDRVECPGVRLHRLRQRRERSARVREDRLQRLVRRAALRAPAPGRHSGRE